MKRYEVDVSTLSFEEQRMVGIKMESRARQIHNIRDSQNKLIAYAVYWDRPEDFMTSSVFPEGCPCREVHIPGITD